MNEPRWRLLWCEGTISRASYFLIGLSLTLVKQALDHLVASWVFGKPWSPLNYALTGEIGGVLSLNGADQRFYAIMLGLALPFLWIGVMLTVQRLRDVGWPLWIVILFFAPMPINIIFFLVLCVTPSRPHAGQGTMVDLDDELEPARSKPKPRMHADQPRFAYKGALLAILIPLPVAAVMVYFGTHILRDYGWSLFVGLPFVLPMLSVVIYGNRQRCRGRFVCRSAGSGSLWRASVGRPAFEGVICIVMMLPLALPIVVLGLMVGYLIVEYGPGQPGELTRLPLILILLAVLPAMTGAEHIVKPEPLLFTCETSIVVDASPEASGGMWSASPTLIRQTSGFSDTGLGYPLCARIEGTGVGAVRHCEFSTGAFVEPIEVWDEPGSAVRSDEQSPADAGMESALRDSPAASRRLPRARSEASSS